MKNVGGWFARTDATITRWMAQHGVRLLRISVGVIFFWFGVLKFFPDLSPAQQLAADTTNVLTFGLVPSAVSLPVLAAWECAVGVGLIFGVFMRTVLLLLFVQMLGTISPVFIFPEKVFTRIPYAPTIEGQYIIKNLVLISAALVIGATVRGGRLVSEPQRNTAGGR
jgi:uncharacterized membrane protein YphA (DoxX/SURF4 family)